MKKILFAALLLIGCGEPAWKAELDKKCAGWMHRAQNASDSLHVEMNCASIAASIEAGQAAQTAAALSAANMGASMSAASVRR